MPMKMMKRLSRMSPMTRTLLGGHRKTRSARLSLVILEQHLLWNVNGSLPCLRVKTSISPDGLNKSTNISMEKVPTTKYFTAQKYRGGNFARSYTIMMNIYKPSCTQRDALCPHCGSFARVTPTNQNIPFSCPSLLEVIRDRYRSSDLTGMLRRPPTSGCFYISRLD